MNEAHWLMSDEGFASLRELYLKYDRLQRCIDMVQLVDMHPDEVKAVVDTLTNAQIGTTALMCDIESAIGRGDTAWLASLLGK